MLLSGSTRVLFALGLGAMVAACARPGAPVPGGSKAPEASAGPTAGLRVVPHGMVGIALAGAERAAYQAIDADTLVAKVEAAKDEAERVGKSTEGSPIVLFYGFDAHRLVYFSGRTHWRCKGLGCWDYVADALYVVQRGGDVETKLGVKRQIDLYEQGGAVRGGMTPEQVRAAWGEPTQKEQLQYVGSERWFYPDRAVLFLNGEVAGIEGPSK